MRPRLLTGLVAAVLLAVPAVARAQHGGGGGRAAGPSGAMSFAGAGSRTGTIRTIPSVSLANGSSVARPSSNPFSVYGVPTPYRFSSTAGSPSLGIRAPRRGAIGAGSIGVGNGNRRLHPPRRTNPGFLFLTGGGYWYTGPDGGDDSEGQPQDAADQQDVTGQQADNRPPTDHGQNDAQANAATPAPEQQEAAPLPDVGSFTLVMRDGTQVDALAFTRAQDKIIYITPDGGRRTVAVSDIDTDSTERVNEERGTPLQMPL